MRRQGKIVEWNDARGFGFVLLNGGDERAFAHISDFANRGARPSIGDVVTYDVVTERGRPKATGIAYAGAAAVARKRSRPSRSRRDNHASGGIWLVAGLLVAIVALVVWRYNDRHQQRLADAREQTASPSIRPAAAVSATSAYQCTGKQHCSQMASCGEARFYLQHCPDTKMDAMATVCRARTCVDDGTTRVLRPFDQVHFADWRHALPPVAFLCRPCPRRPRIR